jgi:hypothetical protein
MQYILDNQPEYCVWSGDVGAFRLGNGNPLNFRFPLYRLEERIVAFQAAQAGAEYIFEDDGGSCKPSRPADLDYEGVVVNRYTATFEKDGHSAVCLVRYWANLKTPMRKEWSGDVDFFRLENGDLPDVDLPPEILGSELAAHAARMGAAFTMEHEERILSEK